MKGDYLLKLFKNVSRLPGKIIFIDDKKSHVDSVALALHQLGRDHLSVIGILLQKQKRSFLIL
ncbi:MULTISPECIES: DUF2608 domain-containing protein [Candidatus Protochlamydia]|uniref:DUF2608 domain-containing protein n=1 Tax=Candidatus Protochlamydia naegleriophila TaxID=389348 RepID=UPI0005095721